MRAPGAGVFPSQVGSGLPAGGTVGQGVINTGPGTGAWGTILQPGNPPLTKTTSYQLLSADSYVQFDCTSGALTATLPSSPVSGQLYGVAKIDTSANALTVTPSSGTVNGVTSLVLPGGKWQVLLLAFDGTNWQSLGRGIDHILDVSAFGAIADSNGTTGNGTDNSAVFNAVAACANATGASIRVPSGFGKWYRINAANFTPITASGVTIYGDGMGVSQLFFDSTDHVTSRVQFGSDAAPINDVGLRDLTIATRTGYASPPNGHAVLFWNCIGVACSRVEVTSAQGFGIVVFGCDDYEVSGCHVHGTNADGIHTLPSTGTHARGGTRGRITANDVHDTGDDGIAVGFSATATNDVTITGNSVYNTGSRGIAVMGTCTRVTVTGNTIYNTWLCGIMVEASQGLAALVTISGNDLHNIGQYTAGAIARGVGVAAGIIVDGFNGSNLAIEIAITGNIIANVENGFIWIGNFQSGTGTAVDNLYVTMTGNQCIGIAHIGGRGATGGAGGGSSNASPTAHYPGIYARNAQDVLFTGNYVNNANMEGFLADANNNEMILVSSNLFSGCNASATAAINCITVSSGKGGAVGNVQEGGTFSAVASLTTSVVAANNAATA